MSEIGELHQNISKGDNRGGGVERKMEGLWIGRRRCCRGLICFSLTDGNSQRKLITLPSHISMCVRDATRGVSKRVGFCAHLFSCQPELLRECDCSPSFTRSLPVSLSFPPHVCVLLSCHLFHVLDLFVWPKANSYSCLCVLCWRGIHPPSACDTHRWCACPYVSESETAWILHYVKMLRSPCRK